MQRGKVGHAPPHACNPKFTATCAEPKMEAQCGSFMATAAQTMTLNGTRTCLAHHKPPPAVAFLCLFLLLFYLQPHFEIMFLHPRLRAFLHHI